MEQSTIEKTILEFFDKNNGSTFERAYLVTRIAIELGREHKYQISATISEMVESEILGQNTYGFVNTIYKK